MRTRLRGVLSHRPVGRATEQPGHDAAAVQLPEEEDGANAAAGHIILPDLESLPKDDMGEPSPQGSQGPKESEAEKVESDPAPLDREGEACHVHHDSPAPLGQDESEDIMHDPEPLDEDLYGVSIASLLRDTRRIARGEQRGLRVGRLSATLALLASTMLVQIFLVYEFKRLVTAKSVHRIRTVYSEYEERMYEKTMTNEHGSHRGVDGHFRPERFANLPRDKKDAICQIPLSQPYFLAVILAIWSFTVVSDIRKILFLIDLFLIRTPSEGVALATMLTPGDGHEVVLEGLPVCMKVLLLCCIFLPRLILDAVLCWLGCRWLTATDDFADVLLNAMALEFILLLKDLLYTAVVPMRDKFETRTMLVPMRRRMRPSFCLFLGAFSWVFVVALWVVLYLLRLQQVLPGYKWDVRLICADFIEQQTVV